MKTATKSKTRALRVEQIRRIAMRLTIPENLAPRIRKLSEEVRISESEVVVEAIRWGIGVMSKI